MIAPALRYVGTIEDDPPVISQHLEPELFHKFAYGAGCYLAESHSGYVVVLSLPRPLGKSQAQAALDEMTGLGADWNAVGSAPPNQISKDLALRVLDESFLMGRKRPTYVTASAEGGVGIVYRSDTRYAAIECLNSGEIWLLWYDEDGNPQSREVANDPEAISNALSQVSALHADA